MSLMLSTRISLVLHQVESILTYNLTFTNPSAFLVYYMVLKFFLKRKNFLIFKYQLDDFPGYAWGNDYRTSNKTLAIH